jgi:hypothetical protein
MFGFGGLGPGQGQRRQMQRQDPIVTHDLLVSLEDLLVGLF